MDFKLDINWDLNIIMNKNMKIEVSQYLNNLCNTKKTKHSVSFGVKKLILIPSIKDMTPEQVDCIWYNDIDYTFFANLELKRRKQYGVLSTSVLYNESNITEFVYTEV